MSDTQVRALPLEVAHNAAHGLGRCRATGEVLPTLRSRRALIAVRPAWRNR